METALQVATALPPCKSVRVLVGAQEEDHRSSPCLLKSHRTKAEKNPPKENGHLVEAAGHINLGDHGENHLILQRNGLHPRVPKKMIPPRKGLEGVNGNGRDHVRDRAHQSHLQNVQEVEAVLQDCGGKRVALVIKACGSIMVLS
ncbi:hypothetical protein MRX96_015598 [Rhipicephalus microplus]|nr:uncharacterized protein LOC119167182 [Rhipicephalus microplus]